MHTVSNLTRVVKRQILEVVSTMFRERVLCWNWRTWYG